jgi:hypothetical protein
LIYLTRYEPSSSRSKIGSLPLFFAQRHGLSFPSAWSFGRMLPGVMSDSANIISFTSLGVKLPPSARWNLEYGSEAITIGHSRTSFSRVSAQKSLADCTARVWCRASYSLTSAPGSGGVHPGAASWRHLIINPHLLSMSWLLKSRDILKPDVFIHPATSSGR